MPLSNFDVNQGCLGNVRCFSIRTAPRRELSVKIHGSGIAAADDDGDPFSALRLIAAGQ